MAQEIAERDYSAEQRQTMAKNGQALPDGSYPIADKADLSNAIQAIGRASNPGTAKTHIMKRARALGAADMLPKDWQEARSSLLSADGDFREVMVAEAEDGTPPLLRNVRLIKPGWSLNGRHYSKEAIGRSAGLWEGAKAFLDHPSKSEERDRPERSVRDLVGSYENVHQTQTGDLMADMRLIGAHAGHVAALAAESKRSGRDLIGLSINALGKTVEGEAEGRKGIIVEEIVRPHSTDVVTTPAAGGGFQLLTASDQDAVTDGLLATASYEQWKASNPTHLERLTEELKTARQDNAAKKLTEEKMDLTEENAQLKESVQVKDARIAELEAAANVRESEALAARLLSESDLPDIWYDAVRPAMLGKDEAGMKAVIEGELGKLRALKEKGLLQAQVKGHGQAPQDDTPESMREGASLLTRGSVDASRFPRPGEGVYEYKARMEALRAGEKKE